MKKFNVHTLRMDDGAEFTGVVEDHSQQEAVAYIESNGYHIIRIEEVDPSTPVSGPTPVGTQQPEELAPTNPTPWWQRNLKWVVVSSVLALLALLALTVFGTAYAVKKMAAKTAAVSSPTPTAPSSTSPAAQSTPPPTTPAPVTGSSNAPALPPAPASVTVATNTTIPGTSVPASVIATASNGQAIVFAPVMTQIMGGNGQSTTNAAATGQSGKTSGNTGSEDLLVLEIGGEPFPLTDGTRFQDLVVPTGSSTNSPTQWLLKPTDQPYFFGQFNGKVWMQAMFEDGSKGEWLLYDPLGKRLPRTLETIKAKRFALPDGATKPVNGKQKFQLP